MCKRVALKIDMPIGKPYAIALKNLELKKKKSGMKGN
jgi:hypothetical protein